MKKRNQIIPAFRRVRMLIMVIAVFTVTACDDHFLDVKPDKKQVVPADLRDFKAMLDNTLVMNQKWSSVGEIASDNLSVSYTDWASMGQLVSKSAYIWKRDLFTESDMNEWSSPYIRILYSNVVLEGLKAEESDAGNDLDNQLKGTALFHRGMAFYELAQLFTKHYDPAKADIYPGLPLRLSSDMNAPSVRSTLKETYERIFDDVGRAAALLPVSTTYKTQPGKPAAYALLSRIHLSTGNYAQAGSYADSSLRLCSKLINYNDVKVATNPFARFNEEVIFHAIMTGNSILFPPRCKVDSLLYQSYDSERKSLFFKPSGDNQFSFYGSYDGSSSLFSGMATDELYLIRAECLARTGNVQGALDDLNTLMQHRYKTGTYTNLQSSDPEEVLTKILKERRKELIFRGTRWADLRRLNTDSRFAVTITRKLDGQLYELKPGSAGYVFPIPQVVIAQVVIEATGMPQNE
jgi:starch-binding outer membrane protein, SusD/RagB family